MEISPEVQKILERARCVRNGYEVDWCQRHGSAYPYDERVCHKIIRLTGRNPRRWLGDGRTSGGGPIYPI